MTTTLTIVSLILTLEASKLARDPENPITTVLRLHLVAIALAFAGVLLSYL